MVPTSGNEARALSDETRSKISYIRQMLGELRGVADDHHADMLCYLLEMAYVEAGDILSGRRTLSTLGNQGDKAVPVPFQSPGKIKF